MWFVTLTLIPFFFTNLNVVRHILYACDITLRNENDITRNKPNSQLGNRPNSLLSKVFLFTPKSMDDGRPLIKPCPGASRLPGTPRAVRADAARQSSSLPSLPPPSVPLPSAASLAISTFVAVALRYHPRHHPCCHTGRHPCSAASPFSAAGG